LTEAIEQWSWERATSLDPTDTLVRARAVGVLSDLHALLRAGEPDAFLNAIGRKLEEASRAYGIGLDTIRATVRGQFAQRATPPFVLVPFEPGALDLRAAAGRRLLVCTVGDRRPVLRFEDSTRPGREFSLPVMLGQVDGRLEVLR
jgi:hypothetical protein